MDIQLLLIRINREIIFWMAWIIIPLVMEIMPAIGGFFILVKKRITLRRIKPVVYLPEITLIIPVYNSADTLEGCLESIRSSNYPVGLLDILLINNQSMDNSFAIFVEYQGQHPDMPMTWMNANQGKAKALNMALFNSHGKYIIHIDSDGKLHKDALRNIATRFEQDEEVDCLTGAILTDMEAIEKTESFLMKIVRRCEFFEYCQSFLAGRNFESEIDSVYTLSGAFSAFRKSAILKSQLYNTATVSEDTQVTFQMRNLQDKGIKLCENAYFFVDPIESYNKLYTQRQRWQRGEIEVSHMFLQRNLSVVKNFFSNFMIRVLMFDHTFAFPRMIWYFALIFLVFLNYPLSLVVGSVIIIYLLYAFSMFLFYLSIVTYLNKVKDIQRYYKRKWYLIFLLPAFNFVIFWIRFAGIINSIKGVGTWKTTTLTEELRKVRNAVRDDFTRPMRIIRAIRRKTNHD